MFNIQTYSHPMSEWDTPTATPSWSYPCLSEIHLQPHPAETIHIWVRYTYSHTQLKLSISEWDTPTATPSRNYPYLSEIHLQPHPTEAIHVWVRYTYSHTQLKLSMSEWDTPTATPSRNYPYLSEIHLQPNRSTQKNKTIQGTLAYKWFNGFW